MSDTRRTPGRAVRSVAVIAAIGLSPIAPLLAAESNGTYVFTGVFRDFRAANVSGGHPDFEANLPNGRGVYTGIVGDTLNEIGEPTFASTGHKCTVVPRDSSGRNIIGPKSYLNAQLLDLPGVVSATNDGAVVSSYSLGQWFNEAVGARNASVVRLPFTYAGGRFTYDGAARNDFDKTTGAGANKNWAYTFEMESNFIYRAGRNDTLTCGADDCMWVFIDGKLVIDLGGAHDFTEQYFEVNRLKGMVEGKRYDIKFFYAERKKTSSRLKIDTTLELNGLACPGVSGNYD